MPENTTTQPIRFKFLRSHRFAQSDFLQKIAATLGSRGIVIILGFFTSIIIARSLGPEGRGQIGIASAITAMGVQLGLLGFHSANTFHVSKNPSLLPVMISNSILISILGGGVTMVLLFFFRHLMSGNSPLPLPLLILSLAIIPMSVCFSLFQGLLTGIQKFKDYNLSEILNKAINTLLILGFITFGTMSAIIASIFQAIAVAVCLVIMLKALFKSISGLKTPSFPLIKNNFLYGGKAYLTCFLGWGITRIDIFILQRFQGFEQVGYFSVALSLMDLLLILSSVVATILLPKLCAESDIKKKWTMTKKTTIGVTGIVLFTSLTVMLCDAPIRWVYGAQFAPCHLTLVYLLPGFIFLSIETILVQFIVSIHFPWRIVLIWGIALILKLMISIKLIPQMGVQGIGISWAIIYLFVLISVLINAKSTLKRFKTIEPC